MEKQDQHTPHLPEERLDDETYIRDMRQTQTGPWHIYDVLLAARGYGWDMMRDWADYMAEADIGNISQVVSFSAGTEDRDVTDSYHAHGGKCLETPELEAENGGLSIGGLSRTLRRPMKIVWYNQTRVLRFITLADDETLIRRYVETVIRRTFGTADAMKLARDLPDGR